MFLMYITAIIFGRSCSLPSFCVLSIIKMCGVYFILHISIRKTVVRQFDISKW